MHSKNNETINDIKQQSGVNFFESAFSKHSFLHWVAPFAILLVLCSAIAFLVYKKSERDYKIALENYQQSSLAEAKIASEEPKAALEQIYQQIRTISFLPSVRRIDRYATNLSADALESIQQIYTNLRDNVAISEVYIVPADLDPDKIDEHTKKPQEPIIMFDALITNHTKIPEKPELNEPDKLEEVEIYEYHQLKDQMTWFKANYPVNTNTQSLNLPFISSKKVITCDNTVFKNTKHDYDRTGIILSVPFFGTNDQFKGTISAIILDEAIRKLLPESNYALINTRYNNVFTSLKPGEQSVSEVWAAQAKPDPHLLFSQTIPLTISGMESKWLVWVGFPDSKFLESSAVQAIKTFQYAGYGIAVCLFIFGSILWVIFQKSLSITNSRNMELIARLKLEKSHNEAVLAKEIAERSNLSKSEFLASISHELHTPLNAIIGFSSIIEDEVSGPIGTPIYREYGGYIHTSGVNLLKMIDDILNYSKIDQLEIKIRDVDLSRVIKSSIHSVAPLAEEVHINIKEESLLDDHTVLQTDPKCLRQVLINLLSNAIKFTPGGGHIVVFSQLDEQKKNLLLQIKDDGIGIANKDISKALSVFGQVDSTLRRKYEGIGLGLPLAKKMTELLMGELKIDSEVGVGTVVTLSLPYKNNTTETLQ